MGYLGKSVKYFAPLLVSGAIALGTLESIAGTNDVVMDIKPTTIAGTKPAVKISLLNTQVGTNYVLESATKLEGTNGVWTPVSTFVGNGSQYSSNSPASTILNNGDNKYFRARTQ